MSKYRHRRTSAPATPFTNPLEPGEIAVNTANRQLAVGDAASGTVGAPLNLLPVRYFDARAQYATGDFVVQAGVLYRAKAAVPPGAFSASQWDMLVGQIDPQYVAKAGDTMTGMLTLPVTAPSTAQHAANKKYVDDQTAAALTTAAATYVELAGDTMSGPLTVPVTPSAVGHAASKQYVDNLIALKSSVIVSDTPPVGAIDSTIWFESDTGQIFVKYNDGNSTQWVMPTAAPGDAIRFGAAQALTAAQQTQARQNSYAAPLDALAYSGMQVNGSMDVSQEKGASSITIANTGLYAIDGWRVLSGGPQILAAALNAQPLFSSLQAWVKTANAAPAASDYATINQNIEGYRVARLAWGTANAQPITVGFWVYAQRPGSYSGAINNSGSTRSYIFAFTVNASATWEYKTVTIPGDIAGTWKKDHTVGLAINFAMMCGATYQTAPGAWVAGNFIAASGQINGVAATSDTMLLANVVVLPGTEAPSAARSALIMRPYGQELLTCKRYWQKIGGTNAQELLLQGYMSAPGTVFSQTISFPEMRAIPTSSFAGAFTLTNVSTPNLWTGRGSLSIQLPVTNAGGFAFYNTDATGYLQLDARL